MTMAYTPLGYRKRVDGIGTICHEFSHCLGLPDMYDTQGNQYGMGTYDLMDQGSYNGDSFQPPYYSAYEKWYCGWATPTELSEATTVKDMKPVAEGGQTFVIYNDNHKDEYYLLENRQQQGWDGSLYGKGLMITHVDRRSPSTTTSAAPSSMPTMRTAPRPWPPSPVTSIPTPTARATSTTGSVPRRCRRTRSTMPMPQARTRWTSPSPTSCRTPTAPSRSTSWAAAPPT